MSESAHIAELKALLTSALERLARLEAEAEGSRPVVDREPPPEAFARAMARRRRKGRAT